MESEPRCALPRWRNFTLQMFEDFETYLQAVVVVDPSRAKGEAETPIGYEGALSPGSTNPLPALAGVA